MEHYIALLWPPLLEPPPALFNAISTLTENKVSEWRVVYQADGIVIAAKGPLQSYPLNRAGIILGQMFQGACSAESDVVAMPSVNGEYLIDHIWGRYIAFLRDERSAVWGVLRHPSNGPGCYVMDVDGAIVCVSHPEDILQIARQKLRPNWPYLRDSLLDVELIDGQTGVFEIREVLAGEFWQVTSEGVTHRLLWHPACLCCEDPLSDADEAQERLKASTQACLRAWASQYGSILHTLSGGLDSAIVLGCLIDAADASKITCLNYFTTNKDGDERAFARAAARYFTRPLVERAIPEDATVYETILNDLPLTAKPDTHIFARPLDTALVGEAQRLKADVFLSGEGGDHLFFNMARDLTAVDYAFDHGITRDLPKIVFETAQRCGTSVWNVLARAIHHGMLTRRSSFALPDCTRSHSFVTLEAVMDAGELSRAHPWMADLDGVAPGKTLQIYYLAKVLHRFPAFGRCTVADVVHPLLSQPLIETCLRIPTYILSRYGMDRGLARMAFQDVIPPSILHRRTKGSTGNHIARMLASGLPHFRPLLLDGLLAQQPFIDRGRLEAILTPDALENRTLLWPLLRAIATEAWLQSWRVHMIGLSLAHS